MLTDKEHLQILHQSGDATAIYDSEDLRISFVNDAMLQIWGKPSSIVGMTFEDALPEVKGQPFADLLKNVWQTGETYKAVDTPATLRIDGLLKTSYFDFEYRAVKNAAGDTYAILHTAVEVSSRLLAWQQVAQKQQREEQLFSELSLSNRDIQKANERLSAANLDLQISNDNITRLNTRLEESETDFKRLVEQAPVAILVFRGPEMEIELANPAMLDILGKDETIIGLPLLSGMPELKGQPAVDLLFEVYRTGKESNGNEVAVRMRRNGQLETHYFNFSYRPLLDNGKIIGVMDVAVEVTDQVLARKQLEATINEKSALEQTLRANEHRLQEILDTMAEGVVIVDEHCKPTYSNLMAQKIMATSDQEFKARSYNDSKWQNESIDGKPLPIDEHPMCKALRTGKAVYDHEIAITLPSGAKIYITINAAPLLDERQRITGGIATFADVTRRRKILEQKEDFINVASHELKTPVTALKTTLQLLERMKDNISAEMLGKLVAQSNKSMNKLSELVEHLLNSNRISQGRFPINKTTFSIADLIEDCCQHLRTTGSHDIVLKGDLDLEITADAQQLDQVMVNLINNAVKYAPGSSEIVIEARRLEEYARISVTDFGPGVPEEKQKHLFDRYYQVGQGTTHFTGLGLGLYICAEIIHKHEGQIGVESRPGIGSTFWFTLPLGA